MAKDVAYRYRKHTEGRGALYTKLNPPERLLAKTLCATRLEATRLERTLKSMSSLDKRRWALRLSENPKIR
ncbi:MAG: hypothetical protein JAZ07_07825 [Candidatus Thiodiazotropha endolucinida]|uniref:GIY-YIG domain-containing protein n=1 Tax=Candidatus Thiodiazotropha taylori TaxID=2792791 RepID=A0A9E4KAR9_9GAMM|nr:hypothetical protein [Candidatus Thiodiazotropha taylori]